MPGWDDRVEFGPGGTFAYRKEELIVPQADAVRAENSLKRGRQVGRHGDDEVISKGLGPKDFRRPGDATKRARYQRFKGIKNPLQAQRILQADGIPARLNHVVFANQCCCGGPPPCYPHPSLEGAQDYYQAAQKLYEDYPAYANPLYANPLYANPLYANPLYANPLYANPLYANASGCGCCGTANANPLYANPLYANPLYANPLYANPLYANAGSYPGTSAGQASGERESSAEPAPAEKYTGQELKVRIAILDTGFAAHDPDPNKTFTPVHEFGPNNSRIKRGSAGDLEWPDFDKDGKLDPVAGHGTFVAGVVEQHAFGCTFEVRQVIHPEGDGKESRIAEVLWEMAAKPATLPHLVNMSFSTYSPFGMATLADAIADLQALGVVFVAAAGNDATCIPTYPAAIPGVIAVGAVDDKGIAAPFTNYGPWVDVSAPGVGITSTFFRNFNGPKPPVDSSDPASDPDKFDGGAKWSGTSFSAPRVVAELAKIVALKGKTPEEAVEYLLEKAGLATHPVLGAIVQ